MKTRFIFLFFILFKIGFSQSLDVTYTPILNFYPQKSYIDKVCSGYDSVQKTLSYSARSESKSYMESFESLKKTIKAINSDSLLMVNDVITNYLQALIDKIKQKNPAISSRRFYLFTYRTSVPNAAAYGNGIILFNLRMIAQLQTESEVAFILCHEMSHDVKTHYLESMKKSYELSNDAALKKEYSKIKEQEYNYLSSYENYVAKYVQRITSKKREKELQADSLGLVFFSNAGFNLDDAYRTIERLDSIDNQFYTKKIDFASLFKSDSYNFNKNWLLPEEEDETIDGGNYIKVKPDSLKTHPDCKFRLEKIKKIPLKPSTEKQSINDFSRIKTVSEYEMLRVFMDEYDLGNGVYNCMQLISLHPQNTYLKTALIEFLYELHYAKVNHYFSFAVEKVQPHFTESYKEVLYFMNNIRPDNLKNLTESYFTSNFSSSITDPYLGYVFTLLKTIDKPKDKKLELVMEYEKKFGKNVYLRRLRSRFYKP